MRVLIAVSCLSSTGVVAKVVAIEVVAVEVVAELLTAGREGLEVVELECSELLECTELLEGTKLPEETELFEGTELPMMLLGKMTRNAFYFSRKWDFVFFSTKKHTLFYVGVY